MRDCLGRLGVEWLRTIVSGVDSLLSLGPPRWYARENNNVQRAPRVRFRAYLSTSVF
jgi:hypothetical protein